MLHNAAWRDYIDTAGFLIEKGAKVYTKTSRGRRPLYAAARSKKSNDLEPLIQKGANINELCPDEYALFVDANNGD